MILIHLSLAGLLCGVTYGMYAGAVFGQEIPPIGAQQAASQTLTDSQAVNPQAGADRSGTIKGLVKTGDGGVVDGFVRASRIFPLPAVVARTGITSNGSFQLNGLPSGFYQLCAVIPAGGYLDPCLWEKSGIRVSLGTGQTQTTIIAVKKAASLKVHIDDPAKLIKDSPEGALAVHILTSAQRFDSLAKRNQDSKGRDYTADVGFDQDFYLVIHGVRLSVADTNGKDPDNGQGIKLNYSSKGPPGAVLNFHITGKK